MQYTQNFLKKKEKDKNGDELDNDSDNVKTYKITNILV